MTSDAAKNSSGNVPLLSNVAAGAITGAITIYLTGWDGHLPFVSADFSGLKIFLFGILPSAGMLISHKIKSIGFKWSLGSANRELIRINKNHQEALKKQIKEYDGVISQVKIDDLKKQLEQAIQDYIDIISTDFGNAKDVKKSAQSKYQEHIQKSANDNPELAEMLKSENKP